MNHSDEHHRLKALQRQMGLLQQAYGREGGRGIIVLEGWDTSGKGGLIRRLAWSMDPRGLLVWPIGPPDSHELRHHWLHRFWNKLPHDGQIAIFDRSWYGRVLVERVEDLATEAQWQRAYREINGFEQSLADEGYQIVKLFLDITPQTQLDRLRHRYDTPGKRWKITEEDLRNRSRWDEYELAYADMLAQTSSTDVPWHKVDFNHKGRDRLAAFELILAGLGDHFDLSEPPPPPLVKAFFEKS